MREYGVPERIRTDNGAPFSGTGILGLSRLSLDWHRLGILHERIQPGKPQQNGRHERMHRTLKQDTTNPLLPDAPSHAKLKPRDSVKFTERWADYINLGVIEWRKVYTEHEKLGKKAILFVMTDDTKNCDDVAAFLEGRRCGNSRPDQAARDAAPAYSVAVD